LPKKQSPYKFDVLKDDGGDTNAALPGFTKDKKVEDPADLIVMHSKKRSSADREYDQEKPHVTFRLIPRTLHEEIKKVAKAEGVLLGELARYFFEVGLERVSEGSLAVEPKAVWTGQSLYPEMRTGNAIQQTSRKNKWALNTPHTYHGVTNEIKIKMDALAENHHIPVGELARYFLEEGLATYRTGDLKLKKTVVHTRNSLYPKDFADN
jgi:hypothetical protein